MLRASFLFLSRRRGLQRFVTRRRITSSLAYRFVAGDRLDDAVRVVADVNRRGWSASLDHLGENAAIGTVIGANIGTAIGMCS